MVERQTQASRRPVVNAAATGLLSELVDVKAGAELGVGTRHHDCLDIRGGVRLPQAVEQRVEHCITGTRALHITPHMTVWAHTSYSESAASYSKGLIN